MTAVAALISLALVLTAGCGLQTEEANKKLDQAMKHQADAEVILARLKAFPGEWEAVFNVSKTGPAQIDTARELVSAREQDVDALDKELDGLARDLAQIEKLNVEAEIKEYVRLKSDAVKCWQNYTTMYLRPLIMAYGGMLDIIAYGRPASEQNAKAQEIASLVRDSVQKVEECKSAEKQAENYFEKNKLGK